MPAVPLQSHAPAESGGGGSALPQVKPAPAVVEVESHTDGHVLPRRFLGPLPQSAVTSSTAITRRKRMKKLRRKAMDNVLGEEGNDRFRDRSRRAERAAARTIRVRRRNLINMLKDEDIQLESDSSDSDDDIKKGKKGKSESWIGNSFDIGREFESIHGEGNPDPAVAGNDADPLETETMQDVADRVLNEPTSEEPQELAGDAHPSADNAPPQIHEPNPRPTHDIHPGHKPPSLAPSTAAASFVTAPSRPSTTRGDSTSGATFVTARTDVDSDDTASTFTARIPRRDPHPPPSASVNSSPRVVGSSQASSTRPLYGGSSDEGEAGPSTLRLSPRSQRARRERRSSTGATERPAQELLKSALRGNHSEPDTPYPARQKTVQFPPNPTNPAEPPLNGDQQPANPRDVLARSGSEINGTSADATADEDEYAPGDFVMRDRLLVKVGRHRDEKLTHYNEMTARREPCHRTDPLEEYACGLTLTTVDFFSDWTWRVQEYWKGTKQLKFSVPLSPVTTLSIFNQTDMSLALVSPWPSIVRQTARSQDSELRKLTSTWDRARHSALADKLGMDRHGSAVFIIKFSERSRALDWYWYIAGQLGLHMPKQIDIAVPLVEQTLRTTLPADASSDNFNVKTVLNSIWEAILDDPEQVRLLRELKEVPQFQLAWKGSDATLDWVAYQTTITGKPRDWALLASFAQCGTERGHRTLQIRDATHHSVRVRLQDGTTLDEPPGVEGYLTRHKVGGMPKETIYVSVNDGHVFMSPLSAAMPPLRPGKAGSSPAAIFPDLHKRFLTGEHWRMSKFVETCAGCISLSDMEGVRLSKPGKPPRVDEPQPMFSSDAPAQPSEPSPTISTSFPADSQPSSPTTPKRNRGMSTDSHKSYQPLKKQGKKEDREFTVTLRGGVDVKFEAHTPEIAAEWVERLNALVKYWTLRPRVDARAAMDAVEVHSSSTAFLGNVLDLEVERALHSIWNWCIIDGCRAITMSSPIYLREGPWAKFRSMYLCLTGGSLISFRVKGKVGVHARKRVYPLFGAYVYCGILALDELNDNNNEAFFDPKARIYSDGLQTSDGIEATTFCIRLTWPTGRFAQPQPWDTDDDSEADSKVKPFVPPRLSTKPTLLICRARSKLERDRWVWAINCEMERYARSHVRDVQNLRDYGKLPRHATVTRV